MARKRDHHAEDAELHDKRKPGWFWMDDGIIETYGKRIAPYGIAVYALLAKHANKDSQAWPSLNTMVETLGISRQSIVRTLDKLIAEKLISKEMRTSAYGDFATNVYTLLPVQKGTSHKDVGWSCEEVPTSHEDQRVRPHRGEGTSPGRLEPEVLEPDKEKEREQPPLETTSTLPLQEKKRKARPSRIVPDDFTLTERLKDWASREFPHINIEYETAKFRDYEFKDAHSDWERTWRTWIRRAAEKHGHTQMPLQNHKHQRQARI